MAKKKPKSAISTNALAALEALEAEEAVKDSEEPSSPPVAVASKKGKKKGPKGVDVDALLAGLDDEPNDAAEVPNGAAPAP
eukprot:CAMPEP_0113949598 /NCGR_PEP_ID=MMETSP1339-20121228/76380_1 /TAXON_ID=94617 /ORGANISM="Fibrocapsa japonica" /LENGTH=80 /DNA_ID=CAMNT_0000957097 /DNA_START=106 /DNA_END=344 /DNA_ORIENTATION=- /assembly_acc=CAM_ASM_000762